MRSEFFDWSLRIKTSVRQVGILKYIYARQLDGICVGCFFFGGFWKVLSVATANVREKITWEELLAPCIKAVTHLQSAEHLHSVCACVL